MVSTDPSAWACRRGGSLPPLSIVAFSSSDRPGSARFEGEKVIYVVACTLQPWRHMPGSLPGRASWRDDRSHCRCHSLATLCVPPHTLHITLTRRFTHSGSRPGRTQTRLSQTQTPAGGWGEWVVGLWVPTGVIKAGLGEWVSEEPNSRGRCGCVWWVCGPCAVQWVPAHHRVDILDALSDHSTVQLAHLILPVLVRSGTATSPCRSRTRPAPSRSKGPAESWCSGRAHGGATPETPPGTPRLVQERGGWAGGWVVLHSSLTPFPSTPIPHPVVSLPLTQLLGCSPSSVFS